MPKTMGLLLGTLLALPTALTAGERLSLLAGEAGFAFAEGAGTPWAGVRVSHLRTGGPGFEYGVSSAPFLVAQAGILALVPDLDAVLGVPLWSRTSLQLRGGASAVVGVGSGGAGATTGINYGAAVLLRIEPRQALRLDYTRRSFSGASFSSITLNIVRVGTQP
jgi:hypothetical protein